jgi:hypothetical protein
MAPYMASNERIIVNVKFVKFWKEVVAAYCKVRGCIQKFPDWVVNEINNNKNKH